MAVTAGIPAINHENYSEASRAYVLLKQEVKPGRKKTSEAETLGAASTHEDSEPTTVAFLFLRVFDHNRVCGTKPVVQILAGRFPQRQTRNGLDHGAVSTWSRIRRRSPLPEYQEEVEQVCVTFGLLDGRASVSIRLRRGGKEGVVIRSRHT